MDAAILDWLANASCCGERYTAESIRERLRGLSTVGAPLGLAVQADAAMQSLMAKGAAAAS